MACCIKLYLDNHSRGLYDFHLLMSNSIAIHQNQSENTRNLLSSAKSEIESISLLLSLVPMF